MSGRLALVATVALSLLVPVGAGATTVSIAPLGVPSAKAARGELKYALGKNWEAAFREEVEADLAVPKIFESMPPAGGDWTFGLSLDGVRRTFDDKVAVAGRGTLGFHGEGRWTWSHGGAVVKEGTFDLSHSIELDRQPWRSDLENGWREIIRLAVSEAISGGLAAGLQEAR